MLCRSTRARTLNNAQEFGQCLAIVDEVAVYTSAVAAAMAAMMEYIVSTRLNGILIRLERVLAAKW